jgi:hypothetical protein
MPTLLTSWVHLVFQGRIIPASSRLNSTVAAQDPWVVQGCLPAHSSRASTQDPVLLSSPSQPSLARSIQECQDRGSLRSHLTLQTPGQVRRDFPATIVLSRVSRQRTLDSLDQECQTSFLILTNLRTSLNMCLLGKTSPKTPCNSISSSIVLGQIAFLGHVAPEWGLTFVIILLRDSLDFLALLDRECDRTMRNRTLEGA